MNNTGVDTKTITVTKTKTELEIKPPDIYDVVILNDNTVNFEAVFDVLSTVLQIPRTKAEEIALHCHNTGKAIVFTGPRDMADTYLAGLRNYAAKQALEHPEADYMGYARMAFEVEKKK